MTHRSSPGSYMTYGPTPEQFMPRSLPLDDTAFTGMIFCRMKFANIAILRCAEYQLLRHCGAGCSAAASRAEVAQVVAEQRRLQDAEANYSAASHNRWRRQRATRPATAAPVKGVLLHLRPQGVCPRCGGVKKSAVGLHCRKCGANIGARRRAGKISRERRRAQE